MQLAVWSSHRTVQRVLEKVSLELACHSTEGSLLSSQRPLNIRTHRVSSLPINTYCELLLHVSPCVQASLDEGHGS